MMSPAVTVVLPVLHVVLTTMTWTGFAVISATPGITSSVPIFQQKTITFLGILTGFAIHACSTNTWSCACVNAMLRRFVVVVQLLYSPETTSVTD